MRLKTFQAQTMTEAMDLVRQSLGDEAIILGKVVAILRAV